MTNEQRQRLEFLERDGRLTPADVVEDAKQKDSPLHPLFEWNVKKAAASHWIERAREIIRVVKVHTHTETISIISPVYVRDPDQAASDQGYVGTDRLKDDPVAARESLQMEFERAGAALKRAKNLAVALGLSGDIEILLEQVTGLRERVAEAAIQ